MLDRYKEQFNYKERENKEKETNERISVSIPIYLGRLKQIGVAFVGKSFGSKLFSSKFSRRKLFAKGIVCVSAEQQQQRKEGRIRTRPHNIRSSSSSSPIRFRVSGTAHGLIVGYPTPAQQAKGSAENVN